MRDMRVSNAGLAALALHEGIVPYPYLDSVGVWTFGIGHTASAGEPVPAKLPRGEALPMEQVIAIFLKDLERFEARVRAAVKVRLAQHEFDALVSFDFNTGGINRANLTKALNAGDRIGAAAGFMGWLRPPEIRKRREAERDLFAYGHYPKGDVPVWRADANGNLTGIERTLPTYEVLAMAHRLKTHAGTVL